MFAAAGTLLNASKRAQNQGKVRLLFCEVIEWHQYLTITLSFSLHVFDVAYGTFTIR